MSKALTVSALRRVLRERLSEGQVESAGLEASFIVEYVTGLSRSAQIMEPDNTVGADLAEKAITMIQRRLAGEPLDHIFGYREFYGFRFDINRHVLSPRPETEMIVDFVLEQTTPDEAFTFVDLGTGSGAIAIAILKHRPNARGVAVDVSEKALLMAGQNAKRHKVLSRLEIVKSDWGDKITDTFDFLLSNPPYIDGLAMNALADDVRHYDPEIALSGGEDGLRAYRIIAKQALTLLNRGGRLAFEIGFDQGSSVSSLLEPFEFDAISITKDLSGHDRIVTAELKYRRPQK